MSLRFAALGLLAQESGSGYDLLKRFENSMANVWAATQSQLYGELGRLEREGLIEIAAEGPRRRKLYAITETGRHALRDWLATPDSTPARSSRLLRVFLLSEVDTPAALAFFADIEQRAEAELAHLTTLLEQIPWDTGDNDFGRIALEHGLRHYRMEADWARWATARLTAEGPAAR
ncbi:MULTISPECIES: PadR family transcriptional regulator [Nocardia]|uniref:PadR family transcriptional regulator n=1 Tax=Nocardia TaxID=1817 RepID=UPI00189524BA|nr:MULTISPECIES: PadR family transcriptional regulator [Nocardia]MBF6352156.1 PadR family transcriptional regulator [Nocardia flavorosea]